MSSLLHLIDHWAFLIAFTISYNYWPLLRSTFTSKFMVYISDIYDIYDIIGGKLVEEYFTVLFLHSSTFRRFDIGIALLFMCGAVTINRGAVMRQTPNALLRNSSYNSQYFYFHLFGVCLFTFMVLQITFQVLLIHYISGSSSLLHLVELTTV